MRSGHIFEDILNDYLEIHLDLAPIVPIVSLTGPVFQSTQQVFLDRKEKAYREEALVVQLALGKRGMVAAVRFDCLQIR